MAQYLFTGRNIRISSECHPIRLVFFPVQNRGCICTSALAGTVYTDWYEIDFPALAPYDLLVQDARIFSRFFTQLLYSHTKKKCNKVAHSLTRYVITSLECVMWTEDVPSQLSFVIQVDIAFLVKF